jgi:TPR repeat protein
MPACENVLWLDFVLGEPAPPAVLGFALERLEETKDEATDGKRSFLLGLAHETGRGRPRDERRAAELYRRGSELGSLDAAKGRVRTNAVEPLAPPELGAVEGLLDAGRRSGDAESCWYLAYMHRRGLASAADPQKAETLLREACQLGLAAACEAARSGSSALELRPPRAGG